MSSTNRLTRSVQTSRATVRLADDLLARIDAAVDDGEYPNRSEAIRDALQDEFGGSNESR